MLALCWSTVCDGGSTLNQHYSGQRLVFVGLFDHADPESVFIVYSYFHIGKHTVKMIYYSILISWDNVDSYNKSR